MNCRHMDWFVILECFIHFIISSLTEQDSTIHLIQIVPFCTYCTLQFKNRKKIAPRISDGPTSISFELVTTRSYHYMIIQTFYMCVNVYTSQKLYPYPNWRCAQAALTQKTVFLHRQVSLPDSPKFGSSEQGDKQSTRGPRPGLVMNKHCRVTKRCNKVRTEAFPAHFMHI